MGFTPCLPPATNGERSSVKMGKSLKKPVRSRSLHHLCNKNNPRRNPMYSNQRPYDDSGTHQHLLNQFIPDIASSQIAPSYTSNSYFPYSHQISASNAPSTHDDSGPRHSSTMAPPQHLNSSVHIHTPNNNDSNLGHENWTSMEGEEDADADGETDEDENNEDDIETYDFIQEEQTDIEMSDDESVNNDNYSRKSMYVMLSSRMNLS